MGIGKFNPPPHKIDTPELINKKVGTVDYVHERTPIPNLVQIHPLMIGLLGKWVKYNKKIFLFIPFSQVHVQVRPVDGFLRATAKKT